MKKCVTTIEKQPIKVEPSRVGESCKARTKSSSTVVIGKIFKSNQFGDFKVLKKNGRNKFAKKMNICPSTINRHLKKETLEPNRKGWKFYWETGKYIV